MHFLSLIYTTLFIRRPFTGLLLIALFLGSCALFVNQLNLEVSGDSLVLENDADLEYYRDINEQYGSDENLIITYQPVNDLFSDASLDSLAHLREELTGVRHVQSVTTLLDVPLLFSPPMSLTEVSRNRRTLLDETTDRSLAIKELSSSALYSDRLVSRDLSTTAIQVVFETDSRLAELRKQRSDLRDLAQKKRLSTAQQQKLQAVERQYDDRLERVTDQQDDSIQSIRRILKPYTDKASIHMGGIPMIVTDMLAFIRHDLVVYGAAVLSVMALVLWFAFREVRWVALPLICVAASALATSGIIAWLGWPISAVSSNFLALLLIFGLSLIIHLIVQYEEINTPESPLTSTEKIQAMLSKKFAPSFYTVLTTVIAFISLVVSDIRPVIDFGWIMVVALVINLLLAFTLFPALLALGPPPPGHPPTDLTRRITRRLAETSLGRPVLLVAIFAALVVVGSAGVTRLNVDNRFIDYFSEDTAIYQGMEVIDEKLGGTTPLELIINAPAESSEQAPASPPPQEKQMGSLDDPFASSPFDQNRDDNKRSFTEQSYWFNTNKLSTLGEIHQYLDSLEDTGKVLSLYTLSRTLERLNQEKSLDDFFLSIFYQNASSELKEQLVAPYLSDTGNQVRISMRVYESDSGLDRQALLNHIRDTLQSRFDLDPEQFRLTGMVVLYNNLLQSLFDSQIKTLGAVFIAIGLTFLFVFRNVKMATLALLPNIVSAICVLGLFGLLAIPLDLMTITVAAISVGIAVDDTIHYIHRLKSEWTEQSNYDDAIRNAHRSIGKALFYTSVIIASGFAVMMFSNFVPTLYFGLFTAFAMLIAMLANMTLLPMLIKRFGGL